MIEENFEGYFNRWKKLSIADKTRLVSEHQDSTGSFYRSKINEIALKVQELGFTFKDWPHKCKDERDWEHALSVAENQLERVRQTVIEIMRKEAQKR